MAKRTAKLLTATLILLEITVILAAAVPPKMTTVNAALETDMPVVFVDPPIITADPGETFTITANIFNLSGLFRATADAWVEGEPLPPASAEWRYNYSLGYLYGFDLQLKWDPTVLEYVSHTAKVPVDTYVDGVLHEPLIAVRDMVDETASMAGSKLGSMYWLAQSSQAPAPAFNAPNVTATAFNMTFRVKKDGKCGISFTNVQLIVDMFSLKKTYSVPMYLPHWTKGAIFQTSNLLTRIESVQGGALIAGTRYDPLIQGEDMAVSIAMKNDNAIFTDTYNLSLYDGATLKKYWESESLGPDLTTILNYTIDEPSVGLHTITAEASILHDGEVRTDRVSRNITVIQTPSLQINGPDSATTGTTVSFSASGSVHNDPDGVITTYMWTLWAPGEEVPRGNKSGESDTVSFDLPPETTRPGNWTVMLVVKDNFGITARPLTGATLNATNALLRPATAPYRTTWTVNVELSGGPGLSMEWIVLAVILIVIIAVAVFYLRRRSR